MKLSVSKALLSAVAITVVSCALLTISNGMPTVHQLLWQGGQMFAGAFIVLLLLSKKEEKRLES